MATDNTPNSKTNLMGPLVKAIGREKNMISIDKGPHRKRKLPMPNGVFLETTYSKVDATANNMTNSGIFNFVFIVSLLSDLSSQTFELLNSIVLNLFYLHIVPCFNFSFCTLAFRHNSLQKSATYLVLSLIHH